MTASTREPSSSNLRDLADVQDLLDELLRDRFAELSVRPALYAFSHPTVFFRSRPTIWSVLRVFGPLLNRIGVNRAVFSAGLPREAARGVLAHELAHTADYVRGGRLRVLAGLWSLVHPGFKRRYERRMDLEAVLRANAAGLADYRRWLADGLEPADFSRKLRWYYSAEELEAIDLRVRSEPELAAAWRRRPPLTADEIGETSEPRS